MFVEPLRTPFPQEAYAKAEGDVKVRQTNSRDGPNGGAGHLNCRRAPIRERKPGHRNQPETVVSLITERTAEALSREAAGGLSVLDLLPT